MRIYLSLLIAIGCLPFLPGPVTADGAAEPNGTRKEGAGPASPVAEMIATAPLRRMDFSIVSTWIGRVESTRRVTVPALEAGRVVSVDAEDEKPVHTGDLLFTLGGPEIDTRAAALRESIDALRARLSVAKDTLEHKNRALEQKLTTQSEVDAARAAYLEIQSNLDATTQSLHALQLFTRVEAPIDGVFTARKVSAGQTVDAGSPLAEVVDTSRLRIVARVFSGRETALEGRYATVSLDDGSTISARVLRVLPERTPFGETLAWIGGERVDGRLKPGQGIQGTILQAVHSNALAVPRDALVYEDDETPAVFVKQGDRYRKQPVSTGSTSGDWVEIRSGLTGREHVVTRGAYELYYRDFNKVYKAKD